MLLRSVVLVACVALLTAPVRAESVVASWYGPESGTKTASGEHFNWRAPGRDGLWTCAHRTAPFGTRFRVTYRSRSIVCRVNDRGPAAWTGRGLDLAKGAAVELGIDGVARVGIERVE